MVATTPTWLIPYAQSTDRLCDGCTITEAMADRIDDILTQFDADLAISQVQPLARASRVEVQEVANVLVSNTAVDFDTTGIADLFQPEHPITIDLQHYWVMGTSMKWETLTLVGGTGGTQMHTTNGSLTGVAYARYIQHNPFVAQDDSYGTFATMGTAGTSVTTRIGIAGPSTFRALGEYVFAWRVSPV